MKRSKQRYGLSSPYFFLRFNKDMAKNQFDVVFFLKVTNKCGKKSIKPGLYSRMVKSVLGIEPGLIFDKQ